LTVGACGDTRACGLFGGQIAVRFARSAGAMLVACRLAGLSALEAHYAGIDDSTQTISPLLRSNLGGKPVGGLRTPLTASRPHPLSAERGSRADFVRRNPIATRRVVRAMVRATEICAAKPDWVAQRLADRGFTHRYNDYAGHE
jgi:hypothetical protein